MKGKDKLKRQSVTLQTKLEVIKRIEFGEQQVKVCKALNLAGSTVRSIFKNKKKILAAGRVTEPLQARKLSRYRPTIMLEMERLLHIFIEESTERKIALSTHMIQEKALSLYNELKGNLPEGSSVDGFNASRGWFERFKHRSNIHSVSMQEEIPSGDHEVPERFKTDYVTKIESDLWKRVPKRTFIPKSPNRKSFEDEPISTINRDFADWERGNIPSLSVENVKTEVDYGESDTSASLLISVDTCISKMVDNSIENGSHSETEENIANCMPPESSEQNCVGSMSVENLYTPLRKKRTAQTQYWISNETKHIWKLEKKRIDLMTKHEIELNEQRLRHNEEKHKVELEILELQKQKLMLETSGLKKLRHVENSRPSRRHSQKNIAVIRPDT